ncbi:hypothetical protein CARUB_v10002883mg [Capsella rubella]|uniref:Pollen Ole e 1 allergen and extensin family protein n=1 Tax=Capsella rubella TaxID=81985 RepID=R0HB86_9BRAS|nr:uncharacterized protein LOC17884031 [Capsella rubella]EOA22285.1 hypothetical protein CARUB_v10002883mg [Capsella rubella]
MAKSNIVLLSILVVMASLSSLPMQGLSLLLPGIEIGQVNIRGDVTCSLTGDPNAPPVSNAKVLLVCAGSSTPLAQALTDTNGTFVFVLNALKAVLIRPDICGVVVNLPAGTCELYPPDGILTASINLFNVVITNLLAIVYYVTGPFLDSTV